MKLWNKTILAAAITLLIAGCDDSDRKGDTNLKQAEESASQVEADKHIEAVKPEADTDTIVEADQAIPRANELANDAADKTKEIKDSMKKENDSFQAESVTTDTSSK